MPTTSLGVGTFGDEVADLHRRLTAHGFSLPSSEVDRHFFGPATRAAVTDCQREHGLPATGSLDAETARALDAVVAARVVAVQPRGVVASASPTGEGRILAENLSLPGRVEITSHHLPGETGHPGGSIGSVGEGKGGAGGSAGIAARVSGVIVLEHGLPASKTKLRLYQRAFGGQKTLLREVETDAQGQYAIPYTVNGRANIEVYGVGVDGKEVQLSRTKFGAGAEERIDLIAPSALQPAAVEFARLKAAVAPHTNNQPELLKEAVERGERRDFTYLAGTTGWDAGALALASQAFTGEARTKIPAEGFYALARAGLPTEIRQLAHVPKQTVASALRQAAEAGIIDSGQIEKSVQAFAEFAANYRFSTSIRGALSSPKDFVGKARISDTDRAAFSKVVRDAVSDDLWERAKASGVSEAGIKTLQLQGKLAYLTFNNAELTEYLAGKVTSDLLVLIDLGYYDATRWEASLRELSGANATKLDALVPPTFVGRTVDERIQTYTAELARRVRQIDPHAVTVDRIATNKLQGIAETESVGKFLKNATSAGFRLGKTPLSRFVAESSENVWSGIVPEKRENVLNSVRTLSSLYALSPHDEALSALLLAGFTSSIAIARYDFLDFSTRLKKWLPPGPKAGDQDVSTKIFWKAQQQSATVFNVFDGFKRLNAVAYAPGSTPADAKRRDDQIATVREKLKGLFPTMETLFGSVDYCECNHCQSVLSPAAYLVDLLHFIDPLEETWAAIKGSYQARTGSLYTKRKPFDGLNDRRPDIKNIALTCENTQTALPYIDVVNEILEQLMMSDDSPPAIEAYDVGDTSSQDLLAEPQNILWSAYVGSTTKKGLRDLLYPITLPFDLPLEMARAFLKQLDLPLWRLRECLAQPSTLGPSANGRTDGWTDIWFERLGLGSADVAALVRSEKWYELFGYDSEDAALEMMPAAEGGQPASTSLRNGKTLARRLGVTYQELVELIRTRFINPGIETLIVFKHLGIDPSTFDRYLGGAPPLSGAERTVLEAALVAEGVLVTDLAPLRAEAIRYTTLGLRAPSVGCDFAKTTLVFDKEPGDANQAMAFVLRKLNAFVRLQKRLGWEIHELDRLLMAVMPDVASVTTATWGDTMKTALIYLAHVEEIHSRFQERLSREEIAVFWSNIPTDGISPLYERLFWASGSTARHAAFKKRLGRVLEDKTVTLVAHVDAVRQAFQLPYEEIEPILLAAGATNRSLSIDNLSILMRYAALAKGLGLSVGELLTLMGLSERKPLSPLTPGMLNDLAKDIPWSETLAFVREVELLAEAGVDVAFVDRICRLREIGEQPSQDKDAVLLALAALPPADPESPEKHQTLIVRTLAAQFAIPEAIVDRLLGSVLKDSGNKPLKESGFSDPSRAAATVRRLRRTVDLIQGLQVTEGELVYLTRLNSALSPNELPVDNVPADAKARALRKGLSDWMELAAARKQFGQSERLLAVLIAARQPIDSINTAAVREKQLHEAVAALTGFKQPGLSLSLEAIGAIPVGGASFEVVALVEPRQLRKAIESLRCFSRIGLNPMEVVQFARTSIDDVVAMRFRSSLKGRYAQSAWRRVAKPIFDGLRKKQRDALVAHLTHVMDGESPKFGDTPEKLFEYLLLDPGMEPVVLASRIQLAIASVQLFVQRCLMNLEGSDVDPQIIDSKRWEWMRRYRVWEVNRKMFIWPENWLDPEFRDDKTHLMRALEGKLLEGDVNEDLVRTALYSYLKGLEEIARLEMLTMYFEPGASADGSIVHVVGRSANAPHKYFYRKSSHGMWTPWEPIEVGIEGEHLVLTSWRGRMHLFWVSFLEQTEGSKNIPDSFKPGTDTVTTASLRGTTTVKLQLHWVEHIQGKWENRSSTPNFMDTKFSGFNATTDDQKCKYFVRALLIQNGKGVEDDDLEIQITQKETAHKFVFFSKLAPPRSEQSGTLPVPPPFNVNVDATKWQGAGGLQVTFVSAVTQHSETGTEKSGEGPHKILGGGDDFTLLFPSNEALPVPARTPPAGVGRPMGYVFRPQNAHHVTYRSGDGNIYDLFWTKNGWFYQSPSLDAEGTGADDEAEPAVGDPHGYALDDRGIISIAYAGTTKLHELIWSQLDDTLGDEAILGTGWGIETLYVGKAEGEQPQGRPFGGLFLPNRGVVFRTKDGRLRAAVESGPTGGWEIRELNAAVAKATSDPTGLLMTKTELGVTTVVSRHIFYLGVDGQVYELRSDVSGLTWTSVNITQGISDVVKPAPGSTPAAYAFLRQNTLHIVYRGIDDRIHELWGTPGSWNYNPIGASFTKATGDPIGYVTEGYFVQHVVYRGEGDEVVELWWSGLWRENILTKSVPSATKTQSDVAGYSFEALGTQHVVHFAEDGNLRELRWNTDGWHPGAYELTNPFPDSLSPLASPFFYESTYKDHTFFVEPFVVETAVHEWTEWIVTTKEYVPSYFKGLKLVPLIPAPIFIAPYYLGIFNRFSPSYSTQTLFDKDAIIRTTKGVIEPEKGKMGKVRTSSTGLLGKSSKVVDVGRGLAANARRTSGRMGGIK